MQEEQPTSCHLWRAGDVSKPDNNSNQLLVICVPPGGQALYITRVHWDALRPSSASFALVQQRTLQCLSTVAFQERIPNGSLLNLRNQVAALFVQDATYVVSL